MTRRAAFGLAVLLLGGCVYYPSVVDMGGPRIRPEKGRAVRQAGGAVVYVELNSTGKFGDVLTGVTVAVARRAQLVSPTGAPVTRLEIPGDTVVSFRPGGHHVVLADLERALVPGEVLIVTLLFEKSGGIGVIAPVE